MYGATETALPWLTMLAFMAALILLNEFSRRWKWAMIAGFVVLPVCLTIFVWIPQAGESETLTWFTYAKVYSALAGRHHLLAGRLQREAAQEPAARRALRRHRAFLGDEGGMRAEPSRADIDAVKA